MSCPANRSWNRDIRSSVTIEIEGDDVIVPLSGRSSIGDVMAHPVAGPILRAAMASMIPDGAAGAAGSIAEDADLAKMLDSIPIGRAGMLAAASGSPVDPASINALLAAANDTDSTTD